LMIPKRQLPAYRQLKQVVQIDGNPIYIVFVQTVYIVCLQPNQGDKSQDCDTVKFLHIANLFCSCHKSNQNNENR
jgi:hypothetical protein